MAALCATLIEHQQIGDDYSARVIEWAGVLATELEVRDIRVLQDGARRTLTHQVFLHVPSEQLDRALHRATAAGITLNAKRKPLFQDTGLRIGVQEIARYRWSRADLERLASVLAEAVHGDVPVGTLRAEVCELARLNVFADDMQFRPVG
jgi:glycine/serine hydroxymethyltransferase